MLLRKNLDDFCFLGQIFVLNNKYAEYYKQHAVMKQRKILLCNLFRFQAFDIFALIWHNVRHRLQQSVIFN